MKRKVGISIGTFQGRYGDMRALEIAKEIGADAVDLDTSSARRWDYRLPDSVYAKSDDEIFSYFSALRRRADELGIEIAQTHGRLPGFKNNKEEDDALIENARRDCIAAAALGVRACVVHSVTTIFLGPDAPDQLMHDLNFDMFSRILEHAKKYNVKIASETFGDAAKYGVCDYFGKMDEFVRSYERICSAGDNAKYMTTCVDTGHCHKATRFDQPSAGDVIRRLGKHVGVLHLNDNNTLTDQHKIPMTGSINWNDVFDALDEVGFDGVYNMEITLTHFGQNFVREEAEFAIKVMKNILRDRYGE